MGRPVLVGRPVAGDGPRVRDCANCNGTGNVREYATPYDYAHMNVPCPVCRQQESKEYLHERARSREEWRDFEILNCVGLVLSFGALVFAIVTIIDCAMKS